MIQTQADFQLTAERPPKPKNVPHKRQPKEPELTNRDREAIHDANVWCGNRSNDGSAFAQPIQQDEEWFRHFNWRRKRAKVIATLNNAGTSPQALYNFINCGAECVLEWSEEEQRHRIRGSYCHSRHCEPCMKAKSSLIAANLRNKLNADPSRQYRFITLTLKHSTTPLIDQIKRLYASFKKLRSNKVWAATQHGGAAMLEVKWNPRNREWHPHLHVVAEGLYLDKDELSAAWHKATGDSWMTDIRSLDKTKDVAFYVAKYVTKGTNNDVWEDADASMEWVLATKGLRTCATYGGWRGFKLLAKPPAGTGWKPVALLRDVIARARRGELHAIMLLDNLQETMQYDPHRKRGKPSTG